MDEPVAIMIPLVAAIATERITMPPCSQIFISVPAPVNQVLQEGNAFFVGFFGEVL